MQFSAALVRRLHWINLPAAFLMVLLQRTPVLRVATGVGEIIRASPVGAVLRSAVAAAASLGALHSLAGATTLSVSSGTPSGVSGVVGTALGPIAMGTIGTQTQPLSWQISGTIPAGLRFLSSSGASLTTSGTLNTPSGVMLLTGTPTGPAGNFTVTLIAFEGANRTLISSPTYTYTITLTGGAAVAPTITTQPASVTVNAGSTATFSVAATGSPTYQWRKDGAALAGATSATLTLTNVSAANAGAYSVVATNSASSVTSNNATLTVNATPTPTPPVITTPPQSVGSIVGGSATFTVVATGVPSPTYQWLKNSAPVAGATGATLTLNNLTLADAGNYVVNATNTLGTVASAAATLTIEAAATLPVIVTQPPVRLNLVVGQSLSLNVSAAGSGLNYQWRRVIAGATTAIPGATSATFTLKTLTAADAGVYYCSAINETGSVDSDRCTVAVDASSTNPGRLINLSVLSGLATAGDTFSLGYVVSGATAANAKPLVIRAAGPSLGALGVGGTLSDPKLELFAGSTKTGENDNWGGSPAISTAMAAVGAFPYASAASLDAVVTANVASRDNSVKISAGAGALNATGTVIAEVYDATTSAAFEATTTPRLINLSVNKNVGAILTMGFVIGGGTGKTMLVRAIGPTLANFGVPGVMVDPKLELFDATGKSLATNDNWGGTAALSGAFNETGAFVLNASSADAALLITLAPGNYTAQVTVATGSTGVALVEVYEVP